MKFDNGVGPPCSSFYFMYNHCYPRNVTEALNPLLLLVSIFRTCNLEVYECSLEKKDKVGSLYQFFSYQIIVQCTFGINCVFFFLAKFREHLWSPQSIYLPPIIGYFIQIFDVELQVISFHEEWIFTLIWHALIPIQLGKDAKKNSGIFHWGGVGGHNEIMVHSTLIG